MTLPAQVRKQVERVQELYKEMEGEPKETPNPETKVEETPPETKAPETTAPVTTPSHTSVQDSPEYKQLEQKYRTLQGMFNAQVNNVSEENKHLKKELADLSKRVSDLQTQKTEPPKNEKQKPKYITEADEKEYGESIEIMRKAAKEEVAHVAAAYEDQISNLNKVIQHLQGQIQQNVLPTVTHVAHTQQQNQEAAFWSTFTSAVPNWEQINNDPGFRQWLLAVDPLTGITRQSYLEDAEQYMDVGRVVAIFKNWESLAGRQAPSQTAPQQTDPRKQELEKQIAPGRGRTVESKPETSKTFTRADVAAFYNDVRAGKYRGREAEKVKIEAEIFAATAEGKIK